MFPTKELVAPRVLLSYCYSLAWVEKSAVSDNFIAASREKLQELMERPSIR